MANKGKVRHLGSGNKMFIAVCGEQRQSPPPTPQSFTQTIL
ncbi:hypothetical protein ACXU4N_08070 [Macrococcus psychrotolerans]